MLGHVRGWSREWSGGESSLLGEFVEGGLVGAGGVVQLGFSWWDRVADLGESGSEQVVVGASSIWVSENSACRIDSS